MFRQRSLPSCLIPGEGAAERLLISTRRDDVAASGAMLDVRPVANYRGAVMLLTQLSSLNPGRQEDIMVRTLAGLPLREAQAIVASWRHASQACGSPDRDSVMLCLALLRQREAVEGER